MEDTDYALGRTEAEYERLIEQAHLLRPLTERMLRAAGISRGMTVLDIGCGVGDVSFLVAELVGPGGSVVGVDLDGEAIKVAVGRRDALGIANVEFLASDARSFNTKQLFDAAVGRLVLMFVGDPTAALRQIAERVHPGGIVAFHEWHAAFPTASTASQPSLTLLQNLIARTFERSGAHLEIGAELYRRMADAGLEAEATPLAEIAVHAGPDDVAYRRWSLFAQSMLPKMLEYGFATVEEIHDMTHLRLRNEIRASPHCTPLTWIMVGQWAHKPMHS